MSNFGRCTALDDLKKVYANLKVQRNDARGTWLACVRLPDGYRVYAENRGRSAAVEEVETLAREYEASKVESMSPKPDSNTGKWTISTDDQCIPDIKAQMQALKENGITSENIHKYLDYEINPSSNHSLAQHASHLNKLMTGLIEKAKRKGLDDRLIAMANTDFERGFMALEKALTTNKG